MNYQGTYAVVYYPKDNETWADKNLPYLSGGFILRPYTVCSVDGHTYGGWINIVEPTAEKEGQKQRVCGVCKHVEYGTVPKLTSGPSATTPSAPATEPSTPATLPSAPADTEPSAPPETEPSVPSSQATVPSSAAPVTTHPEAEVPATDPNPTIYIIIGVLAVALIGGVAWFFLRKRK